jgi:putative flippase GtrA
MAGGLATAIHLAIFTWLNETVLPADVDQLGAQRGWNFFWSFSIAFLLANVVGYMLNRRWVFQPGRHSRLVEIGLFYLLAITAFLLGTPLGAYLVARYPLNEYLVYLLVMLSSVLVNFLGRKFVVFKH